MFIIIDKKNHIYRYLQHVLHHKGTNQLVNTNFYIKSNKSYK